MGENFYGKYYIPHESIHLPCPQKILNRQVWEHETLRLMDFAYHGGDIIHAGTFFGDFLPFLSRMIKKENRVFAFEPIKKNFECAKLNINLNKLNNVELLNNCLTDSNIEIKFSTHKNGKFLGGGSHVTPHNNFDEKSKGIRIDDFIDKLNNCSIIQLDVEGHEEKAILGGLRVIEKFKPILILEGIPNNDKIKNFLNQNGYKFYFKIDSNYFLKSK